MSLPVPVSPTIKPGRWWFVVGAVILGLGPALGVVLLVQSVSSLLPDFVAEIPPGDQQVVQLDQAGEWSLYGASSDQGGLHELKGCFIKGADGGQVSGTPKTYDVNATRGGRQWYWIDSFTVSESGKYTVSCDESGNVDRFAIGARPNTSGFLGGLLGGFAVAGLGFLGGLAIIIVTAVRRSSAAKRLRESTAGQSYPPYRSL
jgi:hypothetical protein